MDNLASRDADSTHRDIVEDGRKRLRFNITQ